MGHVYILVSFGERGTWMVDPKKKRDTPVAEIGHKATKPWDSWAAGMKAGRQYGPLHGKMRKKSATIALKHCITLQKSKEVKLLL